MSQTITKTEPLTLDSLLQSKIFQNSRPKYTNSVEVQLRECQDLYLKAQFSNLVSKIYQYKLLDNKGFNDFYKKDLWNWFLTAISGLRQLEELSPEVQKQVKHELSRTTGGISNACKNVRLLVKEKLLLSYFRAAIHYGSLEVNEHSQFFTDVSSSMVGEIGKLVLEVCSEGEIKLLAKMVEMYLLDLQVRCQHRILDKSLYSQLCRKVPLLSDKLSGKTTDSQGRTSTHQDIILLKLVPRKKSPVVKTITKPVSPSPRIETTEQLPQPGQAEGSIIGKPGEYLRSSSSKRSFFRFFPSWLSDFSDARFVAICIVLSVILRKIRWVNTLSKYGVLRIKDYLDFIFKG
ncbi:HBL058Cp [Eremothecium sinecaudum]|uniref:HBL058Cp n=1 Tax=Eremothecium sinecaudum TaxID=45286 RepID=A0A120K0Z1_9SACH|nr:HBL058Cp [Eremothecium sinecaudum]AMD18844.1 HBL058Cp [Eremothecium sinecaudum]